MEYRIMSNTKKVKQLILKEKEEMIKDVDLSKNPRKQSAAKAFEKSVEIADQVEKEMAVAFKQRTQNATTEKTAQAIKRIKETGIGYMLIQGRSQDKPLSYQKICDQLTELGIMSSRGNPFCPKTLQQTENLMKERGLTLDDCNPPSASNIDLVANAIRTAFRLYQEQYDNKTVAQFQLLIQQVLGN